MSRSRSSWLDGSSQPLPGRTLLNLYGSTEVAADATALALTEAPGPGAWEVPIGRPIDNTEAAWSSTATGREVPPGVVGELLIGGAGVALGYRGDDRLTAARFVDGRYRTGDLACWDRDGNLRYRGRVDRQVKVRGMRIEPAEIEAAVASLRERGGGGGHHRAGRARGVRVVAHVVGGVRESIRTRPPSGARCGRRCRRTWSRRRSWRTTRSRGRPSGKVDARRARRRAGRRRPAGAGRTRRVDPFERALAALWCELLEIEGPIRSDDEFFDLGGHSMLAVELVGGRGGASRPADAVGPALRDPVARRAGRRAAGRRRRVGSAERSAVRIRRGEPGCRPCSGCRASAGRSSASTTSAACSIRLSRCTGWRRSATGPARSRSSGSRTSRPSTSPRCGPSSPTGPYLVAGHSFGGLVAYEMACRLVAEGDEVAGLIVVDSWPPDVGARLRSEGVAPELNAVPAGPARPSSARSSSRRSTRRASRRCAATGPAPTRATSCCWPPRPVGRQPETRRWAGRRWSADGSRCARSSGEHAELVGRTGSDGVAAVVNELLRPSGAGPTARRLLRLVRPRRGA